MSSNEKHKIPFVKFSRTGKAIQKGALPFPRGGFEGIDGKWYDPPRSRAKKPNGDPQFDLSKWGFKTRTSYSLELDPNTKSGAYLIEAWRNFPMCTSNPVYQSEESYKHAWYTEVNEAKQNEQEADVMESIFEAVSLLREKVGTKDKAVKNGEGILYSLMARLNIQDKFSYRANHDAVSGKIRISPEEVAQHLKDNSLEAEYRFRELVGLGVLGQVTGNQYAYYSGPKVKADSIASGEKPDTKPSHAWIGILNPHSKRYDDAEFAEWRDRLESAKQVF